MTISQNGVSDSYVFELPDFESDMLVTSVNMKDWKVTLGVTDRTNHGTDDGEFEVGDAYTDNLGALVGQTVNVGINSDREIEKLSVNDATVVYGVMRYNDDDNVVRTVTAKDNFEDLVTGKKYYLSATASTKINTSQIISVVDGENLIDGNGNEVTDGGVYFYTKLVLNPNGTVSCAVLDINAWDEYLRVTTTDGTTVTESKSNAFDFKDFTIEKDGGYVTVDDLEEDDIVYYESTKKFAEVYNNVDSGEIGNINSETLTIDGDKYVWSYTDKGVLGKDQYARYYKDDVYKTLNGKAEADNVASQKYLKGLDTEVDTTVFLDRLGRIVYIDGVETGAVTTTDTLYVTTSEAQGYQMALGTYIKFKVSDGKEKTIEIPVSQIKSWNGNAGKFEAGTNKTDGKTYEFKFTGTSKADQDFVDVDAQNVIGNGQLVKLTTDEDGKVIGITLVDATGIVNDIGNQKVGVAKVVKIDDSNKIVLKSSSSKIQDNEGTKAKITDETTIWVHTTTETSTGLKYSVTKTAFEDYTSTTNDLAGQNRMFAFVNVANVTDILILEYIDIDGNRTAFAVGDTKDVDGLVLAYTTKVDADGNENRLDTVTIQTPDGVKTTYETDGTDLALPDGDAFARLAVNKSSDKINGVKIRGWDENTQYLNATKNYSKLDQVVTNAGKKIEAADEALILFRERGTDGAWKYKDYTMGQINTNKKELALNFHTKYYDSETGIYTADVIVVEEKTLTALTLTAHSYTPATITKTHGYTAGTVAATAATLSAAKGTIAYYVVSSDSDKLTVDANDGTVRYAAGLAVGTYKIKVGATVTVDDGEAYTKPDDATATLTFKVEANTNTLTAATYTDPAAKTVTYTTFDITPTPAATVTSGTVNYALQGAPSGVSINPATGVITVAGGLAADMYHLTVVQAVSGVAEGYGVPDAETSTVDVEIYAPVATKLTAGSGTWVAGDSTAATITGLTVLDQKGNAMDVASVTSTEITLDVTGGAMANVKITSATLSWDGAGVGTIRIGGTNLNANDSGQTDHIASLVWTGRSEITLENTAANTFTVTVADI